MSDIRKKIFIATCILFVLSLTGLAVLIVSLYDRPYISSINQEVTLEWADTGDRLYYYWSNKGKVDDSLFVLYEGPLSDSSLVFSYNKPNKNPETIYLHVKKATKSGTNYSRYKFKHYINKTSNIAIDVQPITTQSPSFKARLDSNSYAKIKEIKLYISDNALMSGLSHNERQYRLLFSSGHRAYHSYQIDVDMLSFNIGDGMYFMKVVTIDAAGKETVVYGEKQVVDFETISNLIRFNSPSIGPDGQTIPTSSLTLTGNSLILFYMGDELNPSRPLEGTTPLNFSSDIPDVSNLEARTHKGERIHGLAFLEGENPRQVLITSEVVYPADWYYLYYDNQFVGVFLYQLDR